MLLVRLQYHDYILNMLPPMKNMSEEAFQKKITHVAWLGQCLNMYNGQRIVKADSTRPGITEYIAEKFEVEVSDALLGLPRLAVHSLTFMIKGLYSATY